MQAYILTRPVLKQMCTVRYPYNRLSGSAFRLAKPSSSIHCTWTTSWALSARMSLGLTLAGLTYCNIDAVCDGRLRCATSTVNVISGPISVGLYRNTVHPRRPATACKAQRAAVYGLSRVQILVSHRPIWSLEIRGGTQLLPSGFSDCVTSNGPITISLFSRFSVCTV